MQKIKKRTFIRNKTFNALYIMCITVWSGRYVRESIWFWTWWKWKVL